MGTRTAFLKNIDSPDHDLFKQVKKSAGYDNGRWWDESCEDVHKHLHNSNLREAFKLIEKITGIFKTTSRTINNNDRTPLTF